MDALSLSWDWFLALCHPSPGLVHPSSMQSEGSVLPVDPGGFSLAQQVIVSIPAGPVGRLAPSSASEARPVISAMVPSTLSLHVWKPSAKPTAREVIWLRLLEG